MFEPEPEPRIPRRVMDGVESRKVGVGSRK